MALYNFANPDLVLPSQLAIDSSLLLALRPADDNPHRAEAQAFIGRLRPKIMALELVVWLVMPVLQECCRILLTNHLRRAWQAMPPASRPPNWLAAYKQAPTLIQSGLADLAHFDALLAAIPVTVARWQDGVTSAHPLALDERLRYFIARYQLLPQDALILAEAERIGVTAVATLDADWRRAIDFDIYTVLT